MDEIKSYRKLYYQTNKTKLREYGDAYYQKNKSHLLKQMKEYNLKHRDHIYRKITCECGRTFTKAHTARHLNSMKHQRFLEKKEYLL